MRKQSHESVTGNPVILSYIPGCSEEQDHSNQQTTQMNVHLKGIAKQQQKKWNDNNMTERKGMFFKRWVESDMS